MQTIEEILKQRAKEAAKTLEVDVVKDVVDLICFRMGSEVYAIEDKFVHEVYPYIEPTKVPTTPSFIMGIINLRGAFISVVDLRDILGLTKDKAKKDGFILLLANKKIEFGIMVEEILDEMKKKVMNLVLKSMKENNIEVVIENRSETTIETYSNLLLQVLLNIINNAKDILKEKNLTNPKVAITIYEDKESIIIEICDNGGGFPQNTIHHIGEQYFTTKEEKGTGLGIYISKTIMTKQLGGDLRWKNQNEGACFTITLPR